MAFPEVAGLTSSNNVAPFGPAPQCTRYHMIKRQMFSRQGRITILAGKDIAQKYVKPRKGWPTGDGDILFQNNNTG